MALPPTIKITAALVGKAFGLDTEALVRPEEKYLGALHKALAFRIAEMLDTEPQLLSNILYRIDVSEDKLNRILEQRPIEEVPDYLATLVIERQLEKAKWRTYFQSKL